MQKKILVGGGLSLTAVLLAAVLLRPSGGEGTGEGEASADPIPVITEVIQARDVHEIVSGVGTVLAFHDVTVSSETSGKVVEVYAEVGDRVEKGDPLVQVDDELRRSAVEAAEAQLMLAEANFQKAKRDLERSEGLFKTQDISEMELEGARLAAKSAEANYLQAKAALRTAQRRSKDTRIVSPISGQVALRHVDLGTASLEPCGVVDLEVRDPSGRSVPYTATCLGEAVGVDSGFRMKIAAGVTRCWGLPCGAVTLKIESPGYEAQEAKVVLQGARPEHVRVVMRPVGKKRGGEGE